MRISELVERSGVPTATVKYYLREGLLEPGEMVNARDSVYSEAHLTRLRLIRGLVHVLGASLSQVRQVLAIIDAPGQSPLEAMGRATSVLPAATVGEEDAEPRIPEQAIHLLDRLGYRIDPESPIVRQLDAALSLAESAGISVEDEQILAYGNAARSVARADFARVPWEDPEAATVFAVLGTVLYEPVLLALRRLAHYELGVEYLGQDAAGAVAGPSGDAS